MSSCKRLVLSRNIHTITAERQVKKLANPQNLRTRHQKLPNELCLADQDQVLELPQLDLAENTEALDLFLCFLFESLSELFSVLNYLSDSVLCVPVSN